jgi:hypothetical protein
MIARSVPLKPRSGLTRTRFLDRPAGLARTPSARTVPPLPVRPAESEQPRITGSRAGEFPAAGGRVKIAAARRAGSATGNLIPPAPSEFTPKVKLLVRKRAGRGDVFEAACEACGKWLGEHGGEIQHRDARGMGGSKDPVVNSAANAALLCGHGAAPIRSGCHGACEDNDEDMHGMGFWLKEGQDPRTESIMLHGAGRGGLTLFLAADGLGPDGTGYLLQRPELEAAS